MSTRISWSDVDQRLRAQPGEWLHVTTRPSLKSAQCLCSELRWGRWRRPGLPRQFFLEQGAFEYQVRFTQVWARYVGTEVAG